MMYCWYKIIVKKFVIFIKLFFNFFELMDFDSFLFLKNDVFNLYMKLFSFL